MKAQGTESCRHKGSRRPKVPGTKDDKLQTRKPRPQKIQARELTCMPSLACAECDPLHTPCGFWMRRRLLSTEAQAIQICTSFPPYRAQAWAVRRRHSSQSYDAGSGGHSVCALSPSLGRPRIIMYAPTANENVPFSWHLAGWDGRTSMPSSVYVRWETRLDLCS